ncbi:hypothetical protein C5167_011593 [Papaver somniferum]|uniref:F-box domain-containing protein n=1 Tax=Papaver somniferum TaxID=3469 RepID=A0A4Y7K7E8_PAPSO|nr:hypothetical protein C5167_011593 [Papaver somniferum]
MTESTNKRTRNNMEEEGVGGEDRISRLPEPIIHHILTLLPTKCAFSTTILSKGWNNLWITSVPVDVIPKSVEKLCNVKLLKLSDSVFEDLNASFSHDPQKNSFSCTGMSIDYQHCTFIGSQSGEICDLDRLQLFRNLYRFHPFSG